MRVINKRQVRALINETAAAQGRKLSVEADYFDVLNTKVVLMVKAHTKLSLHRRRMSSKIVFADRKPNPRRGR